VLGALTLLLVVLVAAPLAVDVAIGDGIMPGSVLYPVERFGEWERVGIAWMMAGDPGRADVLLDLAEERVDEATYCFRNGMPDKAIECVEEWGRLVNATLNIAIKRNCTALAERVRNATARHVAVLESLMAEFQEQTRTRERLEQAISVCSRGHDIAVAVLEEIEQRHG